MRESPYGKTVVLKDKATGVECWNFTTGTLFELPAGTRIRVEHVNDATHTTVMAVDEHGDSPGIHLVDQGRPATGYRFIMRNTQLRRLTGLPVPRRTRDIVGEMIDFETGALDAAKQIRFFRRLKKDGIINGLQGAYGREAARMGL